MKLTSRGELAIKAMLELARAEIRHEASLSAAELATRCHASLNFLEQVLLQLRQGGFILSTRGRFGGHRLRETPEQISLGQINRYIDGPLAPASCASASQHKSCDWCPDEDLCELKPVWTRVRDATAAIMDSISLADVIANAGQRSAERYVI